MTNASLTKLAGVIVGTATLLAGVSLARAQDSNAAGQVLPTEWFKVCTKQGDNDICNTQYSLIADTRQLITAVNLINVKGKVNQKVIQAVVPTGRVIPPGVQIKIDNNQPLTLNYSVCFPNRCIAEAELTDALVASMKKGSQMVVTSINFQRQANPIPVTLKGFTDAYDGPPKDESALAQRQKELNDALQKQAEERRKKFEDAQNAAKQDGGAGTSSQ
ncbi:invasion associated locus B family protein [Jiella sonneratiae]|uniref:Invasion associated locus B family protein n=1 Tax=Jiella sonneratiae TaxID=2816856 RepID=A0ABS3J9S9_9HYPH|nr:invasion associated locus B family protein [Jiella sonneratiae]MBO0906436.1 invasion associated locus B family protein [Jiella sonneratiae]